MEYGYFDPSALIQRYVYETGRRDIVAMLRNHHCVVSAAVPAELRTALRQRVLEQTLDATRLPAILTQIRDDRGCWTIVQVSRDVLATAEALSGAHPLGTLDAIHVASAKLFAERTGLSTFTFVSADTQQTQVAEALGITTRYVGS